MYHLSKNNLTLPAKNGGAIVLSLTQNSGRIVYRNKINTLIGVLHPGIELGVDQYGNRWIVHHHYKNTYPTIEHEGSFGQGENIFYDGRTVNYNQFQILERALIAWWNGNEYHWLWKNCQHFVNVIAKGESKSEAVDRVADSAMLLGGITALIGLISGNKTVTNIGLGVAAGGAIGKGLSRS